MEGKERKRADDLPAGAVEQVRELLHRPRSSADFSPAARYAVQRLADIDCDWASTQCVRWDLEIGKRIFLTREEAEKALEAVK